jgi:hypothetical protein
LIGQGVYLLFAERLPRHHSSGHFVPHPTPRQSTTAGPKPLVQGRSATRVIALVFDEHGLGAGLRRRHEGARIVLRRAAQRAVTSGIAVTVIARKTGCIAPFFRDDEKTIARRSLTHLRMHSRGRSPRMPFLLFVRFLRVDSGSFPSGWLSLCPERRMGTLSHRSLAHQSYPWKGDESEPLGQVLQRKADRNIPFLPSSQR